MFCTTIIKYGPSAHLYVQVCFWVVTNMATFCTEDIVSPLLRQHIVSGVYVNCSGRSGWQGGRQVWNGWWFLATPGTEDIVRWPAKGY